MPVIDSDSIDDIDLTGRCPVCKGPSTSMGRLGKIEWYRCQNCGIEHYVQLKKENEKP